MMTLKTNYPSRPQWKYDSPHFAFVRELDTRYDSSFAMPTPRETPGPDIMTLAELREEFFDDALEGERFSHIRKMVLSGRLE